MAAQQYRAKLPISWAVQWLGNNLAEIEEFATGTISYARGSTTDLVMGPPPPPLTHIPLNSWLVDDTVLGYIVVMTNRQFLARYEPIA